MSRRRNAIGFVDSDQRRHRFLEGVNDDLTQLKGTTLEVQPPDTPDTEFAVSHPNHGTVVSEFSIIMQDLPGRLYRSSPEKWTPTVSFFKYDAAGGRIVVRLR